jgi:CRP-like cAMP-binding protein
MRVGLPELGPLERALYMRSLATFRDLAASELASCAQLTQERYIRRGEVLYDEGEPIRSLYLLIDGRVRLEHASQRLRSLEASEDVGLVEFLAGQCHRLRAVADSNAVALLIDGAALLDLMEEHFALFLQIRRALGTEILQHQRALASYRSDTALSSVAPPASHDLAEVLLALQRSAVFRDVGVALLASLTSDNSEMHLASGALLWERDIEPGFLALIMEGTVCCLPEGAPEFCASGGALIGVDAVFGDTPYAYRAVAQTPVIARRIDTQLLLDTAEDHFDLATRILSYCASELLRLKDLATARRETVDPARKEAS